MSENLLDQLGENLMNDVRDKTIVQWKRRIDGKLLVPHLQQHEAVINALTDEQKQLLTILGTEIIDSTLHNFLFFLECSATVKLSIETVEDVRTITKGDLQGYLFSWIKQFSQQR